MCHLWKRKTMACGHTQAQWKLERCQYFNSAMPAFSCGLFLHGDRDARPYQDGDIDCFDFEDQWQYAVATVVDSRNHAAIQNARYYLKTLNHLRWPDAFKVHSSLIEQYMYDGSVMDVDAALATLGYPTPSMPHPPQPLGDVVMTQEEKAGAEIEEEWEELDMSDSDAEPFFEAEDGLEKEDEGWESSDEDDFWDAMEISNDVDSVLDRIEEEMDPW
ncbi:uncharacterized protein GGS22DRAFT_197943 [Annulohypoxylon maeteangense]|uniref:uncharacterized protein n=1 Tax=Annulohypoxylon maeteangense TaxID=1927788 RepID=UPI00200897CC|nr:uncharacterized protein GGS22DRAFT_197943 [Annulohypoxylon maeteangense]KAI0888078.1 hypothetical protein GGS22DRAFT_197943 [Annulohypoxylon maeteangense]